MAMLVSIKTMLPMNFNLKSYRKTAEIRKVHPSKAISSILYGKDAGNDTKAILSDTFTGWKEMDYSWVI